MKASKRQVNGNHYKNFAIQPAEFIHRNGIDWLSGNIIKYACRHAAKHGADDVRKIIHYAELILEWQYGETTSAPAADTAVGSGPDPHDVADDSLYRDLSTDPKE